MAVEAGYVITTTNVADKEVEFFPPGADLTYRQMSNGMAPYLPTGTGGGGGGSGTTAFGFVS